MPEINRLDSQTYLFTPKSNQFTVTNEWFDHSYWQQLEAITGHSTGRNITYFFEHENRAFVLRHYYRGGLIGKIANDGYFYTGVKNSRVYREFALLEQMRAMDLPVPKPIAARLTRKLHLYAADIIMAQIENASDVFHLLQKNSLNDALWQEIGKTIANFHRAGVYHADLNIHNIMLDNKGKVWVIDFDRGCFKKPSKNWQQNNINRLLISLNKEKKKQSEFHWNEQNWQALLRGYQTQMA